MDDEASLAHLLTDQRDPVPLTTSDVDADALLATTAAADQAILEVLANQPEIDLPLMVDSGRLRGIRDHVARAFEALPLRGDEGTRRARADLVKALDALDDLGAMKGGR